MFIKKLYIFFGFVFFISCVHSADKGSLKPVEPTLSQPTLEGIMSNTDWMGIAPENARFSDNGKNIFFQLKRPGNNIRDWYQIEIQSQRQTRLENPLTVFQHGGKFSKAGDVSTFAYLGDVYLKDHGTGKITRVTQTVAKEKTPRIIDNRKTLVFWQGHRLMSVDEAGKLIEKANLKLSDKKNQQKQPGYSFLVAQQQRYFDTLKQSRKNKKLQKQQQTEAAKKAKLSQPFFLGADNEIVAKDVSPDGNYIALIMRDKTIKRGRKGKMPHYVTDSGYVEIEAVRTKVGQNSPSPQFLIILDIRAHRISKVAVDALPDVKKDRLKKIRKKAIQWHIAHGATEEEAKALVQSPDKRALAILGMNWSKDSKTLAIMYRAVDNKDRWIATVSMDRKSLKKAEARSQHQLTDKAWINWQFNNFGWLKDNNTIWYQSEESGYSHLYLRNTIHRKTTQLTRGNWEVYDAVLSNDGQYIYFRANKILPGRYEIYRVNVYTKKMQQMTDLGGNNSFKLSHDGQHLLLMHSSITRHPEIFVKDINSQSKAKQLTQTTSKEFAAINWIIPEIIPLPSSHVKKPIYTKVYKPKNYAKISARLKTAGKKFPAVIFVHGAGYTQNAHYGWAYYFHEFMFHTLLVNKGYVVIDMDYRGSKGYGRNWRTAIYRNMGHPEIEDLRDGVNWMVKNMNVAPGRVGVYGGSYGGFLTFMALFRDPDLFAAGAALRPVADWAHYNHGYTSNILNTPDIDPMAFATSSPIEFANGLNKPLLIASGMLDDNVFFQDSVRLVQKLIELKKQNFEMSIYPMEHHGFKNPTSWLNEYRRILKLMETHLK